MKILFTESKRSFLSHFLGNAALVIFASAFASDFFLKYPVKVKMLLWTAFLATGTLAFIISPERRE